MKTFLYTGELSFAPDNVTLVAGSGWQASLLELLEVADRFEIASLRDASVERSLQLMDVHNVCHIISVAEMLPSCRSLYAQSVAFIARRLKAVLEANAAETISGLPEACVHDVLSSGDLFVLEESTCFCFVAKWAGGGQRLQSLERMVSLLRFHLLSTSDLLQIQTSALYAASALLRNLVDDALDFTRQGSSLSFSNETITLAESGRRVVRQSLRQRSLRKISNMFTEIPFMSEGDHKGVLYHLGTCYETKPWVNPLTTRKVVVTASGKGRHTVSRYITSQHYHPISHALPCRDEAGQLSTYWMIDLGEQHRLICNYYSIRSDSCKRGPQSWVLEASIDGEHWSVLRQHVNDHSMMQPAHYHSWQARRQPSPTHSPYVY